MEKILVIEDNEINCMIYKKILSHQSRLIDFAYDGQEGIDKFKAGLYDVVLLDLGLPRINGIEVAKLIREHEVAVSAPVKTPIVVITADNSPQTKAKVMDLEIQEFVTKPFNIDSLKTLVNLYISLNKVNNLE